MFCTDATIWLCLANRRVCPELVRSHIPPPTCFLWCHVGGCWHPGPAQEWACLLLARSLKGTWKIQKNVQKGFFLGFLGVWVKKKKCLSSFLIWGAIHTYQYKDQKLSGGLVLKVLALSLPWFRLWPGNFCMLRAWPKKKKKSTFYVKHVLPQVNKTL